MSLLDAFQPKKNPPGQPPTQDFVQLRVVPFQPEGTPLGQVFMGAELGYVFYSQQRPHPGDLVAVVGQPGTYVAIPRTSPPERDPIFLGSCRCRCPASTDGGMIAYITRIQTTSIFLLIDGNTGDVLQYTTLNEVFFAGGVAIDPEEPHDMYILDERNGGTTLPADQLPPSDPLRNWYVMLKYNASAGGYTFTGGEYLPGAFSDTIATNGLNPLSVIGGECHITLDVAPARFRKWSGSGFTTVNLLQEGAPYNAQLIGPIVTVPDRPARQNHRYCLAVFNPGFTNDLQVLRFTAEGEILAVLQSDKLINPTSLMTVCNRLFVFQSFGDFRGSASDFGDEGGDDGGDTEPPPGAEEG